MPEAIDHGPLPAAIATQEVPAPPAPIEPPSLDLDSALTSWPAVVDLVRVDNAMLAGALDAARPVAVVGGELTLAFPSGASFLKRKAEQDDYRRAAAEAVRAVTGTRLALRYELRDLMQEEGPTEDRLSGEELVRRFIEEFDAEEILEDRSDIRETN